MHSFSELKYCSFTIKSIHFKCAVWCTALVLNKCMSSTTSWCKMRAVSPRGVCALWSVTPPPNLGPRPPHSRLPSLEFRINGIAQQIAFCLTSFTEYNVEVLPLTLHWYFVPFYCWVVIHGMGVLQFVYPSAFGGTLYSI